eukprot:6495948-Pyramimonas_sp.AAC.1
MGGEPTAPRRARRRARPPMRPAALGRGSRPRPACWRQLAAAFLRAARARAARIRDRARLVAGGHSIKWPIVVIVAVD